MSDKPDKFIDENGLRLDGRKLDQIRDVKIEVGVLKRADGSCYLEFGNNKVMAAVYGPREVHPRHQQDSTRAIVRYKYNMASFSVEDRKRPGPDRRSTEVSKVSREALEDQVFTEYFPKSAIDVFVEVLQADAGTRTAALNAASVALADAGIPMRGLVSACAFGKVDDTLVVDLSKDEDNYGQADVPIAMTQDGKITLLQMDGHLTPEELKAGLLMAQEGCRQVYEIQRQALMDHYAKMQDENEDETEAPSVEEVVTAEVNEASEDVNTEDEEVEEEVVGKTDEDEPEIKENALEEEKVEEEDEEMVEETVEEPDTEEDDSHE